jgi:hypothetical protein
MRRTHFGIRTSSFRIGGICSSKFPCSGVPGQITALGTSLAFSVAAQVKEHRGKKVDVKSLPAAVRQTINQQQSEGKLLK